MLPIATPPSPLREVWAAAIAARHLAPFGGHGGGASASGAAANELDERSAADAAAAAAAAAYARGAVRPYAVRRVVGLEVRAMMWHVMILSLNN